MGRFAKVGLLLLLVILLGFASFGCDDDEDKYCVAYDGADEDDDDDDNDDDDTGDWEPISPHKMSSNGFTIVWLSGSPYEMGFQQGTILREELRAGTEWLGILVDLILPLARLLNFDDLAMSNSYPELIEECRGLSDAASDVGWSMDLCMLLNFGDILVEFLSEGFPEVDKLRSFYAPGCSQFAAVNEGTADGRLIHGRSLDWDKIEYLLDYPVIFIRQPTDGIPHAYIGFPGNLSPYSGINASGISVASNEADPLDNTQHDWVGHSHVQMVAKILREATSLEDARNLLLNEDHMTCEIIFVADGNTGEAQAFEMTSQHIGVRSMQKDMVWETNHFVAEATRDYDAEPAASSSTLRFERLSQLVAPDGVNTKYGSLDYEGAIEILRDRVNPYTFEESSPDEFDNNSSIATNGAIYQILFDPADLNFWVAAGGLPVPSQPFVGFSLGELLQLPDAKPLPVKIFE